jgi:signal transduction histidine kinase
MAEIDKDRADVSETQAEQVPQVSTPRFPDVPRLALDDLLNQLIDRAQDVVATQGRLRGLLRANQAIVGNLALPVLLRRIVLAACELTKARYGALGVIDPAGGLEQFVNVGFDEATVALVGHLPEGKGLLGAVIDSGEPIRLRTMSDDPRSVGFPPNHPPMSSFLGVPIRVRDVVFGNLYLTECQNGEFSAEDEELVSALAATAGVAIANARLYDEARRRQEWLQASTEVTQQLLAADGEEPLRVIARHARLIAAADVVTVVLPTADGQRLIVEVAAGEGADELTALTSPIENTLVGLAFHTGRPVLVGDVTEDPNYTVHLSDVVPVGPVMVVPLGGSSGQRGALVIGRLRGRHRFADADLEMATTFANHAAIALELADARTDQQRIVLLEDRDRIARDLHDHVIQRLFAIGLTVQSVAAGLGPDDRADRLNRVVNDLDETIRQTRTSIFQLRGPLGPETGTVRSRLLAVVAEISPVLGFDPEVRFRGPIDAVVPDSVADDLVAVLREALTNAARHAAASRIEVDVSANRGELSMAVADDGVGIGETERRSGLANLRERAERHGGSFVLSMGDVAPSRPNQEGTRLQWTIPLT